MFVATRYATHKRSSSNVLSSILLRIELFLRSIMDVGHFYYIDDQFYVDFPDPYLMPNKSTVSGHPHGRPCFYSFLDSSTGLYWMIPISHMVPKYRKIYNEKIKKYGYCDTLVFGKVLGHEKAFLIQNMFPITPSYIKQEYKDQKSMSPVRVQGCFEKVLISKAKKVLALTKNGYNNIIFPDVLYIETQLLKK